MKFVIDSDLTFQQALSGSKVPAEILLPSPRVKLWALAQGFSIRFTVVYRRVHMASQYRHTSHATYDNKYHIVWITKYRKKVLQGDVGLRLRDILRQICSTEKVDILKGAIGSDHVHLLLEIPPYMAVSRIVQHLKGKSSRKLQMEFPHLHKVFWGQHFWAIGSFCVTIGTVTDKVIKDYIESQGKHEENEDRTFIVLS